MERRGAERSGRIGAKNTPHTHTEPDLMVLSPREIRWVRWVRHKRKNRSRKPNILCRFVAALVGVFAKISCTGPPPPPPPPVLPLPPTPPRQRSRFSRARFDANFKTARGSPRKRRRYNSSQDIDSRRTLLSWSSADMSSDCSPDCSPEKAGRDELSQGNRTQSEDVARRKTSTTVSQSAGSQPAFKPRGKPREGFTWGEDIDLTDTSIRNPTGSPGKAELSQSEDGDDELSQGEDEAVESESDFPGVVHPLKAVTISMVVKHVLNVTTTHHHHGDICSSRRPPAHQHQGTPCP